MGVNKDDFLLMKVTPTSVIALQVTKCTFWVTSLFHLT